jgi:thiamine-monophosphate kinase
MREACEEYALALVGGDLSRGDSVVISVTVAGAAAPDHAVLRSGAKPGERIVVTGRLGAAAAGRAQLGGSAGSLSAQQHALVQAFCRPAARIGEARLLTSSGATSMIDVSDGLAKDLTRLCAASGVGARLLSADVPVAEGATMDLALGGGEDYELIATMPRENVLPAAAGIKEQFGVELTDIGEIVAGKGVVALDESGAASPLEPSGWDHFA